MALFYTNAYAVSATDKDTLNLGTSIYPQASQQYATREVLGAHTQAYISAKTTNTNGTGGPGL